MALYAFDGTLDTDDPLDDAEDSNVVKFRHAYEGTLVYKEGLGMRSNWLAKFLGSTFGFGGRAQIKDAHKRLQELYNQGDQAIDIIGYSRGAALALDFANYINEEGLQSPDGGRIANPPIRFLGLFDTVASFGIPINFLIPFQRINLGKSLEAPPNAVHCFQALALNERRQIFRPTRLNPEHRLPNVKEVWFKGIHRDIGGGKNLGLTSIVLSWMLRNAMECGVPIKEGAIESAQATRDVSAPISVNESDPIKNSLREVLPTDVVHASAVTPEGLANTDEELKTLLPKLKVETPSRG